MGRQVKALRVLKRLVSGNGQAVAVLLAEEGGLESLLAHYLSPLVIQVSHACARAMPLRMTEESGKIAD